MDFRKIFINKMVQGIIAFSLFAIFVGTGVTPFSISWTPTSLADFFWLFLTWLVIGLIMHFSQEVVYKGEVWK
jgi:hypothetical protein